MRSRRIPNWLTYPTFVAGLALHYQSLGPTLISVALAAALFGPMYWLGGVGGGDLKLALAVAALLGEPQATISVFLWTTIAGAVLALGDAARKGQLGHLWKRLVSREARQTTTPLTIPYGPAFFVGVLIHAISQYPPGFI